MQRRRVIASALSLVLGLALAIPLAACVPVDSPTPSPSAAATGTGTVAPSATPETTAEPTPTPYDENPPITFGPTVPGGVEDTLSQYFDALPRKALKSGEAALAEYKGRMTPVAATANLDAVFGAYSSFVWELWFSLMDDFDKLNDRWQNDRAAFLEDLAAAGFQAIEVDGSFVIEPDYQVIYGQLNTVLSARANRYCLMMVVYQDTPPTAGGEAVFLNVSLTTLCNMLADWDDFCDTLGVTAFPNPDGAYKGHYDAFEIRRRLRLDLLAFDIYANQPMFDESGVMTQAFRDAYDYYLATSPDSSTADLIASYKAALAAHDWKRNPEATDVLGNHDLQYMSSMMGG